ncbi:hypothetical protein TSAR_002688 [Trichomalopsis sarcophagae]|uniref:Uncharacterized protein n=1 Tax=Trichomalopsis sarcophagae TaxID=543379 RepID=A0A232ERQ3_9HYME|nr:hypothetical protein TSAR_002688 [Trichomalopsis sarcophagae]
MENTWETQTPTNGLWLAKSYVKNKFQATRNNKELPFSENCIGYRIIKEYERDAEFLNSILWTDKATYVRTEMANAHNEHYWADENPHLARKDYFQKRLSINVWAGIIGDELIGPSNLSARLDGPNHLEFSQMLESRFSSSAQNVKVPLLAVKSDRTVKLSTKLYTDGNCFLKKI